MQIPSNPYSAVRTPSLPASRREDLRAEDARTAEPTPTQTTARSEGTSSTGASLPADMQRVALRGRTAEAGSSYANRQALAEYADVARRDASSGLVEVLGFDAYV